MFDLFTRLYKNARSSKLKLYSTKFSSISLRIHQNNEQLLVWDLWCLQNV